MEMRLVVLFMVFGFLCNEVFSQTVDVRNVQEYIVDDMNHIRPKRQSLQIHKKLMKAAQIQLNYIVQKQKLTHGHKLKKWRRVNDRLKSVGVRKMKAWGENALFFYIDDLSQLEDARALASRAFEQWKDSKGHYLNMINSRYTHVGHAFKYDAATQRFYAVQVFVGFDK